MRRPLGIALVAVVDGVVGLVAFLAFLAFVSKGALLRSFVAGFQLATLSAAQYAIVAVLLATMTGLAVAAAAGTWTGRRWAWPTQLALSGLAALAGLASLVGGDLSGLPTLLLGGLAVWYFLTPPVRTHFGRVPVAQAARRRPA